MGKLTDMFDQATARLRRVTVKVDDTTEAIRQSSEDAKAAVTAKVEATKQAAEDAKANANAKIAEVRKAGEDAKAAANAKIAEVRKAGEDAKAAVTARVEATKQAAEDAKAAFSARQTETAQKLQASVADVKAKLVAKKVERDKAHWESYIASLLTYAEDCHDGALFLEAESEFALASAAMEIADFIEAYGDEEN